MVYPVGSSSSKGQNQVDQERESCGFFCILFSPATRLGHLAPHFYVQ